VKRIRSVGGKGSGGVNSLITSHESDLRPTLRRGGLGVHLARRVTDTIEYRRQDDRNMLRMRKKIS